MLAPGLYLIALLIHAGLAMAFCAGCLALALFPKFRSVSIRAAGSMAATFPAVIVYQILSLPLMACVFGIGLVITVWAGLREHPMGIVVFSVALAACFSAASLLGFISGWRVGWYALKDHSFSAGWRREFLVATFRWARDRKRPSRHSEIGDG